MNGLFGRTKELAVEFCDRCSSVCTRRCRGEKLARQRTDELLRQGRRLT